MTYTVFTILVPQGGRREHVTTDNPDDGQRTVCGRSFGRAHAIPIPSPAAALRRPKLCTDCRVWCRRQRDGGSP